jgi:hypothetical protein
MRLDNNHSCVMNNLALLLLLTGLQTHCGLSNGYHHEGIWYPYIASIMISNVI